MMEEKSFLLFWLGEEEFALDVTQVYEVLLPQPIHHLPQAPYFLEGVIILRDRVIVILDLLKKFQLKAGEKESEKRFIICRVGKFIMGLIVDRVDEVIPFDANLFTAGNEFPSGITQRVPVTGIMRAGERVIFVLDLEKILSGEESKMLSQATA